MQSLRHPWLYWLAGALAALIAGSAILSWAGVLVVDLVIGDAIPVEIVSDAGPKPNPSNFGPFAAESVGSLVQAVNASGARPADATCDAASDYCWATSKGSSRLLLAVAIWPQDGCTQTRLVGAQLSGNSFKIIESSRRLGLPFGACPDYVLAPHLSLLAVPLDRLPKGVIIILVTYRVHPGVSFDPGDAGGKTVDLRSTR